MTASGLATQLICDVSVAEAFDPRAEIPTTKWVQARALWDTGATNSVVTPALIASLQLQPVGKIDLNHGGGVSQGVPTYLVTVRLPNGVGFAGVLVSEMATQPGFDFIIGMDIMARGDLAITHVGGRTCMSFRTPSCERVDYVQDAKRLSSEVKIPIRREGVPSRNAPCSCGKVQPNGKPVKYKNCHGR